MKKTHLVFFILIFPVCLNAQKITLELGSGVYFSQMRRLSDLNEYIRNSSPFDTELFSNFPGNCYYMPTLIFNNQDIDFGVSYLSTSTGSRVSSKNILGEYIFDIKAKANAPAIYLGKDIPGSGNLSYKAGLNLGMIFSKLHFFENVIVDNHNVSYISDDFKSYSLYLLPRFELYYNLKFISLGLNVGSLMHIFNNKRFYILNKFGYYLEDTEKFDPTLPQWNGFQLGLSVSISY